MALGKTGKIIAGIGVVVLAAAFGAVGGAEIASHRLSQTIAVATTTSTTSLTSEASGAATGQRPISRRLTSQTASAQEQINPDVLAGARQAEVSALAGSLHLTTVELAKDRRNGQSIAQIAQSQNVPLSEVSSAALAAAKTSLDQAAALGGITRPAEQRLLTRLSTQIQQQLTAVPATRTSASASATISTSATATAGQ